MNHSLYVHFLYKAHVYHVIYFKGVKDDKKCFVMGLDSLSTPPIKKDEGLVIYNLHIKPKTEIRAQSKIAPL